jgi:MYXO-CTERM domain-containing protein
MRTIKKAMVQLFVVVQICIFAGVANAETKVACIGDSITALPTSWCGVLSTKLGAGYNVGNFGVSGTTLLENTMQAYKNCAQYTPSHDFAPNIVVIMLGTNDSMPRNWANKADFVGDYEALIDSYTSLPSHPKAYVNFPPPASEDNVFTISGNTIEKEMIPLIKEVAKNKSITAIDCFTPFGGAGDKFDPSLFGDGVHPTAAGQELIAKAVYDALMKPDDGGKAGKGGSAGSGGSAKAGGGGKAGGSAKAGAGGKTGGSVKAGGGGNAGSSVNTGVGGKVGGSANVGGSASLTGAGGSTNASGNSNSDVNAITVAGTSAPTVSATESSSSGCGCRMAGNDTRKSGPAAVLLLLVGIAIRRRRREVRGRDLGTTE